MKFQQSQDVHVVMMLALSQAAPVMNSLISPDVLVMIPRLVVAGFAVMMPQQLVAQHVVRTRPLEHVVRVAMKLLPSLGPQDSPKIVAQSANRAQNVLSMIQ